MDPLDASAPWNLVAVTVLGLWLLAAPAVFDVSIRSGAADTAHIGGAVVVVAAVVAMGEPVRALRAVGAAAGLAVAALVFLTGPDALVFLTGPDAGFAAALVVTGLAIALLSIPRGRITERYGTWQLLTR